MSLSGTRRDTEKQFFSMMILKCKKPQMGLLGAASLGINPEDLPAATGNVFSSWELRRLICRPVQ
jgi:hypothetical protein